jgi:hypothetical protein
MIRHILRAAAAAALFITEASSQSTSRSTEPREKTERAQRELRPDAKARPEQLQQAQRKQQAAGQPSGETKPMDRPMTPAERARCFLERHPEIRARLFAKADTDRNGKLSPAEREQMKQFLMAAMQQGKERAQEKSEEHKHERADRREQREEKLDGLRDKHTERSADTGGDDKDAWDVDDCGRIAPRERAQQAREKAKNRADRNDDGRVGPRERARSQPTTKTGG